MARPLPSKEEKKRLWLQVQVALAAFLPVYFAPAYREMERRKIVEKKHRRALAIQAQMQQERVNVLRGSVGLNHLKKLGTGAGSRRSKFRGRLPPHVAIAPSPLQCSESEETSSLSE